MTREPNVVAVVVTWNRRTLLAEALAAVLGQTRPPDRVVVVDNASTDDTADLLRAEFPGVRVLQTSRNLGGAGGFAIGIRDAVGDPGCDLVWLMDDDTVPEPTALETLLAARSSYAGPIPALLASRVIWTDGRDHPMNTPRPRPGSTKSERLLAAGVGCMPIRSASFVSVLLDAAVIRDRGLPVADYFLWNDDFEYSTRITRGNVALYCPGSVVVHKTQTFGSTDADPGARFYYEVRNKAWLFTRSRCLAPREKAVYGGASVLRWVRTLARSGRRRLLLDALRRGLADGLRAAPRPNDSLLAGEPARVLATGDRR